MIAHSDEHVVVVNEAGVPSRWPSHQPVPPGWLALGKPLSLDDCLADIDRRYSDGPVPVPALPGTLLDLVARSVAATPGRIAVSDGDRWLSYIALDRCSDALAAALAARGVRPGDHVAVHLDRGIRVFVALLGILKAGGGYVPIDVRVPKERRERMISASRAVVVLTSADVSVEPPETPVEAPPVTVTGQDTAAVLFTSGSSGTPKGIVLQHGSIAHFATNPALPLPVATDRVGHASSVSFDAFHIETWWTFAAGAELAVLPAIPDLVSRDMQRELRRRRITVLFAPAMAVNHLVREDRDAFAPLRVLSTGGDVVSSAACRAVLDGAFAGEFVNLYGPTETTTASTAHRITGDDGDAVPIGRDLEGEVTYVLDEDLAPVQDGEVGELYIGGVGLARGYLAGAGATAAAFLPDPFIGDGGRMYATGDLARRRADGALEFAGRADDQVKIRGYRVEPREVEVALHQHPAVADAAVIAVGEPDRHLVALVVPQEPVSPKELREHTGRTVPEYMVPSSIALVDGLPANDHGKRDGEQLQDMASDQLRRGDERGEARNEVERYLLRVWEDLLAVEQVGTTDDFFELGGNSLLAFRLQRRISRDLQVAMEPEDVLGHSRLEELAAVVRERGGVVA